MAADFRRVRTHGQSHLRVVGNNVVFCPGLQVANRDYRGVSWLDFPAHNGLERHYNPGGDDDRVDSFFRRSSMTAFSVDRDLQRVRIGFGISRRNANHSSRKQIRIVQRYPNVGFWEASEK